MDCIWDNGILRLPKSTRVRVRKPPFALGTSLHFAPPRRCCRSSSSSVVRRYINSSLSLPAHVLNTGFGTRGALVATQMSSGGQMGTWICLGEQTVAHITVWTDLRDWEVDVICAMVFHSTIVTRPRHVPSPFDPPTRTA